MSAMTVSARGLAKRYGKTFAVDRIDFDIAPGRIVGLIGPNGSGKTTTLKAMLGLIDFEGELKVLGYDPRTQRDALMKDVCFIADVAVLPRWISVAQAIEFVAGVHILYRKQFYKDLLERYFDEEKTIIVTTHQVEEIEHILTDLVFIRDGKLALKATMDEVGDRFAEVMVGSDKAEAARALKPIDERAVFGKTVFLFDGQPRTTLAELGELRTPGVADLFVATMKGTYA